MRPPAANRRLAIRRLVAGATIAVAAATAAFAQEPPQPRRLGVFFWHDSPNDRVTFEGIRAGLAAARMPFEFVTRDAGGDAAHAKRQLAELRASGCELVFAMGTQAARLAATELRDVPVVFAAVTNPVAAGVVPTWQGAEGNVCGASNLVEPQTVLSVFRLAVPGLRRLGMLRSEKDDLVSRAELAAMRALLAQPDAPAVELFDAEIPHSDQVEPAVRELLSREVDAIWVPIDLPVYKNLDTIRKALGDRRIPIVTTAAAAMGKGPVVGAVPDYPLHGRRAAALALQILRDGKQPRELPVDRMSGCLVKVDLAAAHRVDLDLPLSLLVLADELFAPESDRDRR
jgi:putative ABC transport system substrate-binding protein